MSPSSASTLMTSDWSMIVSRPPTMFAADCTTRVSPPSAPTANPRASETVSPCASTIPPFVTAISVAVARTIPPCWMSIASAVAVVIPPSLRLIEGAWASWMPPWVISMRSARVSSVVTASAGSSVTFLSSMRRAYCRRSICVDGLSCPRSDDRASRDVDVGVFEGTRGYSACCTGEIGPRLGARARRRRRRGPGRAGGLRAGAEADHPGRRDLVAIAERDSQPHSLPDQYGVDDCHAFTERDARTHRSADTGTGSRPRPADGSHGDAGGRETARGRRDDRRSPCCAAAVRLQRRVSRVAGTGRGRDPALHDVVPGFGPARGRSGPQRPLVLPRVGLRMGRRLCPRRRLAAGDEAASRKGSGTGRLQRRRVPLGWHLLPPDEGPLRAAQRLHERQGALHAVAPARRETPRSEDGERICARL